MSNAGWYPDPGGQQGMYRWWDGSQWTPMLTQTPAAGPPQPTGPTQAFATTPKAGASLPMQDGYAPGSGSDAWGDAGSGKRQRSSVGPVLVLGLVGLLLVGLVFGAIYLLGGGRLGASGSDEPASNPTANVCPSSSAEQVSPAPHTASAGRVQGGKLSYPELGSPWGAVTEETRVPFGSDVYGQSVLVEESYQPGSNWVASLVVGELVAGDGFFSPEQGSEIVTRCVLGVFYGDAEVQRTDVVNEATTVDGHDAWLVEMHLSFDIEGLDETGETAIILIVATGTESSSLYYASIPDSRPDLLVTAREVQAQLQVES